MLTKQFDQFYAGAKTLWVIRFKNQYNDSYKRPSFDFFLPNPAQEGKTLIKATDDTELQTLEFFNQLQKVCSKIKNDCLDARKQLHSQGEDHPLPIEEKVPPPPGDKNETPQLAEQNINQTVESLNRLLQVFTWLIKHFYPPPSSKNDQNSQGQPPSPPLNH